MSSAEIELEDFERTVRRGCNKHIIKKSRQIKISDKKKHFALKNKNSDITTMFIAY